MHCELYPFILHVRMDLARLIPQYLYSVLCALRRIFINPIDKLRPSCMHLI